MTPSPDFDAAALDALRSRIGDQHLGRRLRAQVDRSVMVSGLGKGGPHIENLSLLIKAVERAIRLCGLYPRGRRNALNLALRENVVRLRGLPRALDGLRLLHLSDLHLDGEAGFGARVAAAVARARFDLCALTGDFRFMTTGPYERVGAELAALAPALACRHGAYGILGNHDFIEFVPMLEAHGVRMLLNEAVAAAEAPDPLWLVGLDDAHFYGAHDFDRALRAVPDGGARILLVHSPELIPEARQRGFGLYLCGHTHAGQMCLPGGWPPIVNAHCHRRYTAGAWRYDGMPGYTSRGTGSSGIFARFHCPPEITVHVLRCG
jgi:predicted MPP superfamily phosphohydrolase